MSRPCRIHQAKGERHRARARVETVKLRGNSMHRARARQSRPLQGTRPDPCRIRQVKGERHRARVRVSPPRPCRIRQIKGELHRARVRVSPPRCFESVKLRGNSSVRMCRARVESVKLRGNAQQKGSRFKARGSRGPIVDQLSLLKRPQAFAKPSRSVREASRPCRIRQAKGERHRARVRARVESVKLRGNERHRARARVEPSN